MWWTYLGFYCFHVVVFLRNRWINSIYFCSCCCCGCGCFSWHLTDLGLSKLKRKMNEARSAHIFLLGRQLNMVIIIRTERGEWRNETEKTSSNSLMQLDVYSFHLFIQRKWIHTKKWLFLLQINNSDYVRTTEQYVLHSVQLYNIHTHIYESLAHSFTVFGCERSLSLSVLFLQLRLHTVVCTVLFTRRRSRKKSKNFTTI